MKKSVILLTLLLAGSIAGTYVVYKLFVKQSMLELGEHLEEEKKLRQKIAELEDTFFRTKPEVVLSAWRSEIQPWADAADRRTDFFNLGDIPLHVEIPEEERDLAKWFYKKEQPKIVRELETRAYERGVILPDPAFGTPDPNSYGQGDDPPPGEISRHLARLEFGKAIADLLIDAGVKNVAAIAIWPETVEIPGRNGDIKSRTTGLSFTIPMRDLVIFIDKLSQKDRYFEVKALKLSNTELRNEIADLNVQMVLAQAYYAPAKQAREVGRETGSSSEMQNLFPGFFGGGKLGGVQKAGTSGSEKTWWQKFRQKFSPF